MIAWKLLVLPYNYVQTKDYYWIGIVILNHLIVYELFVLERNTWNQFVLKKTNLINYTKNIHEQWMQFPNF